MQSAFCIDASSSMQQPSCPANTCYTCAGSFVPAQEHTHSCRHPLSEYSPPHGMLYGATFSEASSQSSTGPARERSVSPSSSRDSLRREYVDRDNDRMPQNSRLASYRPVSQLPEVCLHSNQLIVLLLIDTRGRHAMYKNTRWQVAPTFGYKHGLQHRAGPAIMICRADTESLESGQKWEASLQVPAARPLCQDSSMLARRGCTHEAGSHMDHPGRH